jgi:NADP-dependent 3-hydroxy acid dehydrogenase YdfG
VTDLPGERLDGLVAELGSEYGENVIGVPMDVTDAESVASAISKIRGNWGSIESAVISAGVEQSWEDPFV